MLTIYMRISIVAGFGFKTLEAKLKPDLIKTYSFSGAKSVYCCTIEILSRYFYQKGAIRATLGTDPNAQKAREVFKKGNILAEIIAVTENFN
jgi:hypothetical protein